MIIRQEQSQELDESLRQKFEDDMMAHLRSRYPERCESYNDKRLRAFVRTGIDRAATRQLVSTYDVSVFLTLMMALDPAFDHNPAFAWASELFDDTSEPDPSERLENVAAEASGRGLV